MDYEVALALILQSQKREVHNKYCNHSTCLSQLMILLLCLHFAVTQILVVFVKMFNKSREENERQADAEKRKLEKEAMKERAATNLSAKKDSADGDQSKLSFHIQKHVT